MQDGQQCTQQVISLAIGLVVMTSDFDSDSVGSIPASPTNYKGLVQWQNNGFQTR
jgi:hypothetical protein